MEKWVGIYVGPTIKNGYATPTHRQFFSSEDNMALR